MLVFEVRHWITNHEAGIGEPGARAIPSGTIFYGSKGYLSIWDEDHGRYSELPRPRAEARTRILRQPTIGNNWANFIDAVRTRKHDDLNAPIEEGAISTTLVHLANISYRLGRTLHFDAASYSLHRRRRGQPHVPPRVPQAVRRAGKSLTFRTTGGETNPTSPWANSGRPAMKRIAAKNFASGRSVPSPRRRPPASLVDPPAGAVPDCWDEYPDAPSLTRSLDGGVKFFDRQPEEYSRQFKPGAILKPRGPGPSMIRGSNPSS